MRVHRYGSRAVLVDLAGAGEVLGLDAVLAADPPDGVEEVVPAARTVLVRFDPRRTTFERLVEELGGRPLEPPESRRGAELVVPVSYDGADLAEVAARTGLSEDEVVRRHTGAEYRVAFCGFAPGFGYLTGLPPELHLPRRGSPRVRVPAGAVAVAGEYTAVYPHPSPGGWHLLGRTPLAVWDADREPPNLLAPGTTVRFRAT
ncbi:5-oxoprolinase subunit B family protein [Amycolatopsis albispora]|uniref:Allophanate hydrolase n=1 Tax=Amycolatopsis albispora TaxID=1804986 RepID=A0A344LKQ7_9PSEU|nr:allophanate hydrolase subunit 1 [Amycolatopsis albispora]AXB48631.1 allophanate hydrolase [Amycolatopsis albispora]